MQPLPLVVALLVAACQRPAGSVAPDPAPPDSDGGASIDGGGDDGGDDGGAPADSGDGGGDVEAVPGADLTGADLLYDPTVVHELVLTLDDAAVQSLRDAPTTWVEARLELAGQTFPAVGLRIKGSASFQPIDQKPALKVDLDMYTPGARLHGLERLTLNNEVWDPTMMAETMSYRAWRENGAAAPRTGYARVELNGRLLGVYALLETMDMDFVEHNWPGSEGALWEMTRSCDFSGDCSCFSLQADGAAADLGAIAQGCAAYAAGTEAALRSAFDWDRLMAFMAVERAVNHPDSYTFNLNNFFVYHEPAADLLSLSPWGADSTFIYAYPPSAPNPDCDPLYLDVDVSSPAGALSHWCLGDAACRQDLGARLLEVAAWMEEDDLAGRMERTAALLDPYAAEESYVNWTVDDRQARVACFVEWVQERPDELRAWVAAL